MVVFPAMPGTETAPSHRTAALLWAVALVLMLGAAVWQRLSGPTHPRLGRTTVAGQPMRWRLLRSGTSGEPFLVTLRPPAGVGGVVRYRRYPGSQPFTEVPLQRDDDALVALLPAQPPAGRLEYFVLLRDGSGELRLPPGEPVVMRFKGEVPALVLIPHVVVIFLSMLIGVRAALAALLGRPEARRYAWVTLVGITLGGMILGPVVQKYAFGALWTGWPFGSDVTDDKTAVMWLAWIAAVAVVSRRREARDRLARVAVALAAAVMIAVYVVPHSLRGSQLDYSKLRPAPGSEPSHLAQ
ncbi:MAG TPA: hypothetical protein VMX54_01135 [Vicinamibacteria bacterium]|nr:hypothetical protein [Vicinamibacteria bacterium]